MLELENNDQIDVLLQQQGGADEDEPSKTITLHVCNPAGKRTAFKVKMDTKFEKIFKAFSEKEGVAVGSMNFLYDGIRLKKDSSPKMYEMQDGDQIDVAVEQTGGAGL